MPKNLIASQEMATREKIKQEKIAELNTAIRRGQHAREALKNPFIKDFLEEEEASSILFLKSLPINDDRVLEAHSYLVAVDRLKCGMEAAIEEGELALHQLKTDDKMKGVNI